MARGEGGRRRLEEKREGRIREFGGLLGTTVSVQQFRELIRTCAQRMDDEDKRRIDAKESTWHPVAGGPTAKGAEICQAVAQEMRLAPFGVLVYYLLAYTWNDALDWAGVTTLSEGGEDGTNEG